MLPSKPVILATPAQVDTIRTSAALASQLSDRSFGTTAGLYTLPLSSRITLQLPLPPRLRAVSKRMLPSVSVSVAAQ